MYAIIDIETTGGSPKIEKITEIAILIYDGNQIVDEYTTLINPEKNIPYYITGLTGISNEMVADAPKFYEVAKRIIELTENTVFVAHNASFDFSFLCTEFKSLGYEYSRERICTVKLSRKLIPGLRSYSLGNLCADIGIKIKERHRAKGDAMATARLFDYLLKLNKSEKLFEDIAEKTFKGLHPDFDKSIIKTLPESTGVYYFFNDKRELIYIGKSTNIRKRVLSHLSNNTHRRYIEMKESIVDIQYEITGSEMVALLLESEQIKKHMPFFNRSQRWSFNTYGLYSFENKDGYICFKIDKNSENNEIPIVSYKQLREAKEELFSLAKRFNLCQKLCGLYESAGACFYVPLNECKGACTGEEPVMDYNQRAEQLLNHFAFRHENFYILDRGRSYEEKTIVKVEKGKYIGFGFIPIDISITLAELDDYIKPYKDNRDVHFIINSFLKSNKIQKLIPF